MAVSRIETTIVLGLLGIVAAGAGSVAWSIVTSMPETATAQRAAPSNAAPAQSSAPTIAAKTEPQPPAPFVATVENESSWKPEVLPVGWPSFTKLPDEKPLPPKPTKLKIEAASLIVARWEAYTAGKAKDFPTSNEAGTAIKYLLTIDRTDPAFPDAWAVFVKVRQAAWAIAREVARLDAKKTIEKEETDRKRLAKTRGVSIGMSKKDVLDSKWGKPRSVNTTTTASGDHEQWVYGGSNYLYFDDGRLTSIQTGP